MRGFTLVEILIVLAIIAMLSAIVIVAINPARQFAQTRNTQRWTAVNSILNAIHQNMVDNDGLFTCAAGDLPSSAENMEADDGDPLTTEYDICSCLVDTYVAAMPYDPSTGSYTDCSTYDTGFTVVQTGGTAGRVTVAAPGAELGDAIAVTR